MFEERVGNLKMVPNSKNNSENISPCFMIFGWVNYFIELLKGWFPHFFEVSEDSAQLILWGIHPFVWKFEANILIFLWLKNAPFSDDCFSHHVFSIIRNICCTSSWTLMFDFVNSWFIVEISTKTLSASCEHFVYIVVVIIKPVWVFSCWQKWIEQESAIAWFNFWNCSDIEVSQ